MTSDSPRNVRKAVIPAAGWGTRFLPATKAVPKEMLPIVDKPAIQYVVEEAVRAGLDDVCVVSAHHKHSVENHFDRSVELEQSLEASGKTELLDLIRGIAELAEVWSVRQGEAKGLGHAIGCARRHVGGESFAVLLPDDIMHPDNPVLTEMLDAHERTDGAAIIAFMRVPADEISLYGCADAEPFDGPLVKLNRLVEKPPADEAPSDLAVMGRYVFPAEIFDEIERTEPGKGGEIQITDAIDALAARGRAYGYVFEGGRYDTGTKSDFLRATVELALEHPELGADFRDYLKGLAADL